MPKSKQPGRIIDVAVFPIGVKMESGCVYTEDIANAIIADIGNGVHYTIEEVSPVERQLKHKLPYESWPEHAMADSISGKIINGRLVVSFQLRTNKYGKLLATTLDTTSTSKIRFFPVGFGDTDPTGNLKSYKFGYVAFEVI